MDISHHDLLSSAGIKINSASSPSSGAEESSLQQSEGMSNRGCEGENGKTKPWLHQPGEKDLPVCDRDKDKEGDQDGCSQERMDLDISRHELLSSAGINSNSASSASSGTEESSVQQNQGVDNCGCEGENGKKKPYWHQPGEKDLPVCDRDKDKGGDQDGCSQKKMDLDISQQNLLSSPGIINSNSASSAPKDNVKEDDQEGCSQEKLEDNTEQCHGPSGGVEPSTNLAKVSLILFSQFSSVLCSCRKYPYPPPHRRDWKF